MAEITGGYYYCMTQCTCQNTITKKDNFPYLILYNWPYSFRAIPLKKQEGGGKSS